MDFQKYMPLLSFFTIQLENYNSTLLVMEIVTSNVKHNISENGLFLKDGL